MSLPWRKFSVACAVSLFFPADLLQSLFLDFERTQLRGLVVGQELVCVGNEAFTVLLVTLRE